MKTELSKSTKQKLEKIHSFHDFLTILTEKEQEEVFTVAGHLANRDQRKYLKTHMS